MVTKDNQVDWDDVSHVISSKYRKTVLKQLAVGPATPSQIDNETGVSISHVSRALGELRERELVELLVSEDRRKGRVYGITDQGADLWDMIKEMDDGNEDKKIMTDGGVVEDSSEQTPQCAMCGEPEPNLTLTADSFLFGVNLVVCQECNEDPLDRATVEASERYCPSCERDDKTVDVWTTTDPANPRPDYVGCARCEIMGCFR